MSRRVLSKKECSFLKLGLKYGLATRSNESNILAYAENIWERIDKSNICHNELCPKSKIKNVLRGLTFTLINFEDARILKDSKKIKIIQQLRQNVAILKPDKGNGIDVLDNENYVNSVEQLFKDQTNFKILDKDSTITRITTRHLDEL